MENSIMEAKQKFMEVLNLDNVNDLSENPNANRGGSFKCVETILQEVFNKQKEELGMSMLYDFIPESKREKTTELIDEGALYIHDRTNILIPYCVSLDLSRLLNETTNFGRLNTKPVQRIDSYLSTVGDAVTQFAFYVAGAIGIGTLFMDVAHLMRDKHQWSVEQVKYDPEIRKYLTNEYQQLVHNLNYFSRGTESAFTNLSIFDEKILESLEGMDDELIAYTIEAQKVFLTFFNQGDPSADGLPYTFPIVTINSSDVDSDFMAFVSGLDFSRYNFFMNKEAKFAMCCRLQTDSEFMRDLGGSANSFGASPATIGSHRVVTINFNNLALQSFSLEHYYQLVKERCTDATVILKAHKDLLHYLHSQGVQPLIEHGWINMNRMFSTIGVIGLYEASRTLISKFVVTKDQIETTLDICNDLIYQLSRDFGLVLNIEQVPGEAVRFSLCNKDKQKYGPDLVPYDFYANQFVPLTSSVRLFDKIDIEGGYYESLTGGGIAHLRLPDRPSPSQFRRILKYALRAGCGHIAFSVVYSICAHDHVTLGKLDVCEKCGSEIVDYYERIVGYFQRVSSWGVNSRTKDFKNRKFLIQ